MCGMTNRASHIRDMATLLKPGGWMEVHEYAQGWYKDGDVCSGERLEMDEGDAGGGGASRLGLDLDCGLNAREYMIGQKRIS